VGQRSGSDEAWVLDLCDTILGESSKRQATFNWLLGDPTIKTGRRARLQVDAYWPRHQLVVEYREKQHYESIAHFDKPGRLTATGVPRSEQRARYDQIRDEQIPANGLQLVVIKFDDLVSTSRGRLRRNGTADGKALIELLGTAVDSKAVKRGEVAARLIVHRALGVAVLEHDTQAAAAMVDATFTNRDGTTAAMEIVRVVDEAAAELRNAVSKDRRVIDGLESGWGMGLLRTARVNEIHRTLGPLLLELESRGIDSVAADSALADNRFAAEWIRTHHVRRLIRMPGWPAGRIYASMPSEHGVGADPDDLPRWVTTVLGQARYVDVGQKLAAHPAVDQRHAFLWADSPDGFQLVPVLDGRISSEIPAPDLPDGITHVWVATMQGLAAAWSPERGWWSAGG